MEDLPNINKTVSTVQAVASNNFLWQQLLNPIIVWLKLCDRGRVFQHMQVTGGGLTPTLLELLPFYHQGLNKALE